MRQEKSLSSVFSNAGGKVYTQVIPNASAKTEPICPKAFFTAIVGAGIMFSMFHSSNNYRINHSILFAHQKNYGIEIFWNQDKRHMHKFNGIPAKHFELFLKEFEWRFNNRDSKTQLKQLSLQIPRFLVVSDLIEFFIAAFFKNTHKKRISFTNVSWS